MLFIEKKQMAQNMLFSFTNTYSKILLIITRCIDHDFKFRFKDVNFDWPSMFICLLFVEGISYQALNKGPISKYVTLGAGEGGGKCHIFF